jgi:RNase P/RNase MRP subunit p29
MVKLSDRVRRVLSIMVGLSLLSTTGAGLAGDVVMHSGNVLKIDKEKGVLEIELRNGGTKTFTVTDKDILASTVWKKRLNVGDGVDVKTDGDKVVTVLRRNLPVTIRPPETAAKAQ